MLENMRHSEQLLEYQSVRRRRRRRTGQPLKKLPAGYNCEAETGHLLA
jgi:hypothetical protein